ncbi:MAG: TasA family protein [Coriobacteriia bacterium]
MKRVLVYVAIVAAALSAGGARAYFTAQTEVRDNVIRAGTVQLSTEPTSAALSIGALAPGETVSKTIEVKNTGTLAFDAVTTAAKKAGITDFWTALQCRVSCEGVELYNGPLSAMRTAPVRVPSAGTARLTYSVTLPADAGNSLQGDYVRASIYVNAEQAR